MISKNQIKHISSLHQKKFRKELGLFIAETPKVVDEFLHSAIKITEIYGVEEWMQKNISKLTCEHYVVTEAELTRITALQSPNQVLAVCQQPVFSDADIRTDADLFLYLDGVSDPGNVGTVIRMADWFGVKQLFCSDKCAEVFNSKVVQSTMGSLARVQVFYKTLKEAIHLTETKQVLGADLNGENLYDTKISDKTMLVIGSEAHGISQENQKLLTKHITIPQADTSKTESLNAAVATSIILSEFFRQKNISL